MLRSLQRRPRAIPLVRFKRRLTGEAPLYEQLREEGVRNAELARRLSELEPLAAIPHARPHDVPGPRPGTVTRRLVRALNEWQPDLDVVDEQTRALWEQADEHDRLFLRIRLAVWQDAPGFCERSGLLRVDPPPEIHAMARGPLAAGGGLNAADVVADALEAVGTPVGDVAPPCALDFGGSSGRVVRVLQAVFPGVEWHSCDPNGDAVAWASEHLPGVAFHRSPQEPPLDFETGSFGLVFAISVWSHLSEAAALRWFSEMHRILAPGGLLVPTVQSWQTTRRLAAMGLWAVADVREAVADMYVGGHHFRRTFGPGGDFGVESPDWGFALMSPEWLLAELTPEWQVLLWRSGAHEHDQDVVVLRRC